MFKTINFIFIFVAFSAYVFGCHPESGDYVWNEMTGRAAYPQGYNYQVFVMNGEMRALNGEGWTSRDGINWTRSGLPDIGLNPGYQRFVQFKDAIYALGAMQGNYTKMKLSSKISRTLDFKTWETVAETSNLPARVFYGALVYKDKIWLIGGYDGVNYYNDVWNSKDGVRWHRVAEKTGWSPRLARTIGVFKNKIWIFGGGAIDGDREINPDAKNEVWNSDDGINWAQIKTNGARNWGWMIDPIVFDGKLWLVGANRDGNFSGAVLVSADGVNWNSESAPWSPRGGAVVWVAGDRLFMTGGKFSREENGELKFVYSNDVWALSRKTK